MSEVIILDTHVWLWLIIATALEYQANLASINGLFAQYSELDNYLMR
jgi:PIN domain nuclease of toxin-antitoxin system